MLNLLVVAPSSTFRRRIGNAVRRAGSIAVSEAQSGVDALRHLRTKETDLVITELNLDDMAGTALVSTLRSIPRHEDTPVLLLSPRSSHEDVLEALESGVSGYVIMPFEDDVLVQKVRTLAEKVAQRTASSGYDRRDVLSD